MPTVYIIGGCNGAGKTTASFTMLPQMLDCKEFVNADSIAAGISPFQPEKVAFEAGRVMLDRIRHLITTKADFAFETTLATKSYKGIIKECKKAGYERGLKNLFRIFILLCDHWFIMDNSGSKSVQVAEGGKGKDEFIYDKIIWNKIKSDDYAK
ncbi:MAG: zeta toxin [Bacteroidetes bacterium]|nr:MAG: zeta toxin [Bacteroidota bacterium]